ncbi:MAG: methyltransferase domain-containing protein [Candidatus Acidiferrales bacterium]
MTLEECRRFYAEEVRLAANVSSPALVEAFARVPREKFLGPGPWEIASADIRGMSAVGMIQMAYTLVDNPRDLYHNVVVVLDKAGDINNGQPGALARWIDAMDLKRGERAYHLGCGVGYYTAMMAEVVGPEGSVTGVEVNPNLAARSKENLAGYSHVTVVAGDGATFDPGPCDAMMINAGTTHPLPLWLDRLRDGGRLVVPLTMATKPTVGVGVMAKIIRRGSGFAAEIVSSVAIYSCASARDPQREPLLRTAMTTGALMKMKSVRRDAHEPSETCVLHGAGVCLSSAELG